MLLKELYKSPYASGYGATFGIPEDRIAAIKADMKKSMDVTLHDLKALLADQNNHTEKVMTEIGNIFSCPANFAFKFYGNVEYLSVSELMFIMGGAQEAFEQIRDLMPPEIKAIIKALGIVSGLMSTAKKTEE